MADIASELAAEIESFTGTGVHSVTTIESTRDFVRRVKEGREKIVVVQGNDAFTETEWKSLDLMRSRLESAHNVVLLLSEKQVDLIVTFAPNLTSWLVGGIWRAQEQADTLSEGDKEARLRDFRQTLRLTDDDVIRLAEMKKLPPEPEFSEWLMLLGRDDLLES